MTSSVIFQISRINFFNMIKWLFFDIDDTLWDFKRNSMISLSRLFETISLLKERFDSFESFSSEYHKHNGILWQRHSAGEITSEFLKTERFRLTLFPDKKNEEILKVCRELNDDYLYRLCRIPNEIPYAEEVLATLSKHYLIGAVTNGFTDTQYTKIYTTGLWRYITRMIISDEIGVQKPSKEFFDYVFMSTGAFPEESVVIGDNPVTDIEGAIKSGIDTVFFNPYGIKVDLLDKYKENAHKEEGEGRLLAEISDLRELQGILTSSQEEKI